ncbi:hypothetical protein F5Y12DRAFT_794628 [Xylaria sp. FL1777]|nr:hypothetical protein F5Y12DRAFT_794628 [Xylaria sp. FL1777]
MVYGWQLWLSPRPVRRTETPVEPRMLSPADAALYEFIAHEDGRFLVKETHFADNKLVRNGLSGPPLHIHIGQTEYFKVLQGTLSVVKNEKLYTLTKDDGIFQITPGSRHRFWAHPSIKDGNENLEFHVWAEPDDSDRGFTENYLRNALGYLRDCQQQGLQPSIFQMALLGWLSDTIFVAFPFYVPIWLLNLTQNFLGHVVGRGLLGYKATYPEYNTKPRDGSNGTKKTS